MNEPSFPRGPGLFEVRAGDQPTLITNIRRLAGAERPPGTLLIGWAAWLLAALGAGVLYVSFRAQYTYIFTEKHEAAASYIEAAMLDLGLIVFTLLALGLARAGKPARTERALIIVCAFGSAAMNYGGADTASPRSVAVYVAAPVFLAVVVDRVVAVIRRHVLGDEEDSAWTALGRAARHMLRLAGLVALYLLRLTLAPLSTARGLRRMVLDAAPVPGPAREDGGEQAQVPRTKKAALLRLYRAHPDYGNRRAASKAAAELAPEAGLQAGTARSYIYAELAAAAARAGLAPGDSS